MFIKETLKDIAPRNAFEKKFRDTDEDNFKGVQMYVNIYCFDKISNLKCYFFSLY